MSSDDGSVLFPAMGGKTALGGEEPMAKKSAGILMYRWNGPLLEVFLVHPGGPFWKKRDLGAWSLPKGEYDQGEDPLLVARREFREETGLELTGELLPLSAVRQPGGKSVRAWAVEGDCDLSGLTSNLFTMTWPPRSGTEAEFPEVDQWGWFPLAEARGKILPGQIPFLEELCRLLHYHPLCTGSDPSLS